MKIQAQLPDSGMASSIAGARPNPGAQPVQNELPPALQAQVELAAESRIQVLLEQVAKMLEHQDALFKLLPKGLADEPVLQTGVFPSAEEALANGLPSLLKGAKTAADSLTALAQKAGNAALLRKLFPEGMPPALIQAVQTTMSQIAAKNPDLAGELQGLIRQLMSGPVLDGKLLANVRELCRQLMPPASDRKTASLVKELAARQQLPPALRQAFPGGALAELQEVLAWVRLADGLDWDAVQPPLSRQERGVLRDLAALAQPPGGQADAEAPGTRQTAAGLLQDPPAEVFQSSRQLAQRAGQPAEAAAAGQDPVGDQAQAAPQAAPGQANKPAVHPPTGQVAGQPSSPAAKPGETFATQLAALFSQLAESGSGDAAADKLRVLCRELIPRSLPPQVFARLDEAFAATFSGRLKQAVTAHNLPELRQALVWLKVAECVDMAHLPAASLKQAEETLQEMVALTQRPAAQPAGETLAGHKTLSFALPLYLGEEKKPYPAYIHISQDREPPGGGRGDAVRDTWLRLCLLTENLGLVDLIFHLYGQNMLTIKAGFGEAAIADSFRRELSAIRQKFHDGPFTLTDITVTAPATELPLAEPTLGVYDHNGKPV
ncbi:MAG TPA: hypothetical protein PKA10_12035 [Selenomonadales bacterium]|nr:hypothetical protein [Selenomonadales bacterium]